MKEDQKVRRLIIGNDHGGYELKLKILDSLADRSIEVTDVGSDHTGIVRYPYYAARVAGAVSRGEHSRGILICSTGIGMSIIANKFRGVRAAHVTGSYTARMTRLHNDSNILCLGGKILGVDAALDIVDIWLSTGYMGGRHDISLDLIREAEETMIGDGCWETEKDEER